MLLTKQGNHAIAKMTARCAQYMSALKIVRLCKRKISRRLRKNLHVDKSSEILSVSPIF